MDPKDSRAFTILVRESTPALLAYLRATISDPQAVDDIYQETMVTAWRKLGSFDVTRPFASWVRGIARMHALEYFSRVSRRPKWCSESTLDDIEARLTQIESRPGDTWEEKVSALESCLDNLAPDMKVAVEQHYREGLSTDVVAAKIGVNREAIKKRLQRGRRWLMECLRRTGVFDGDMRTAT